MKPGAASNVPEPEHVDEILPEHLPQGELCIVVFGPGEGESILVRLPDGSVGVVDGCREPSNEHGRGDPIRELLCRIERTAGVPKPFRLKFVCLTHPHADHYGGLGRLLEAYQGRVEHLWSVTHAQPKYEEALVSWIERCRAGTAPDDIELQGLMRVFERLQDESKRVDEINPRGFSSLTQEKRLLRSSIAGIDGVSRDFIVDACGPSDSDLRDASNELHKILYAAAKGEPLSRKHDPNLMSGALLIQWGDAAVLLAGDLLRGKGAHSGWQRAHAQIDRRVQVVNVAHHASEAAHLDDLWRTMRPELAIVTPFKSGAGPNPPRPERIAELERSSIVAITSPPAWEGLPTVPVSARSVSLKGFAPKNAVLSVVPKKTHNAIRNAVAVALDSNGKITKFVLAGQADVYHSPVPS